MIHLFSNKDAADNLESAFELDENLKGEILCMTDDLSIGPITCHEGESFMKIRTDYHREINKSEEFTVEDENTLKLLIARALREEEPICFWMAPNAQDTVFYYWILPYFKQHPGLLHTIQIVGLPFLNEKGQLFYPTHFSQIPPKEFSKTKRLLKEISPAEFETDGDEWQKMVNENSIIRTYEGGKKILSRPETYFDTILAECISNEFQKAYKIVNETYKRIKQIAPHTFIEWRLRRLIPMLCLDVKGDTLKSSKEFELKLPTGEAIEENPSSDII